MVRCASPLRESPWTAVAPRFLGCRMPTVGGSKGMAFQPAESTASSWRMSWFAALRQGLRIEKGHDWRIEGCDFSDNFHDPDFGWGDNGRRGGIVLIEVTDSVLQNNRANRVWDACSLYGCE